MVPFTVLGGFLGTGKTTLINFLLNHSRAPRCAILVNDFGKIAIDAALIKSHGGDTIALKNGCVCCTIGDDLGRVIGNVLDSPTLPQRIIVEASGVSHPGKIADVARISSELSAAGVVVTADGTSVQSQLEDCWISDTVSMQLHTADLIVTTKLDQLSATAKLHALIFLSTRFPDKPLIPSTDLAWSHITKLKLSPTITMPLANQPAHAHFVSRSLCSNQPVSMGKLAEWITKTPAVYRFKGWVTDHRDNSTYFCQNDGRQLATTPSTDTLSTYQIYAVVIGPEDLPSAKDILTLIVA